MTGHGITSETNRDGLDGRPAPDNFLEQCRNREAGSVVSEDGSSIAETLATVIDGNTTVAWLQAQSCSGCTVSTLQSEFPEIEGVLGEFREAASFHPTLMAEAGEAAMDTLSGTPDVLIVEGSVPVETPLAATLGRDEHGNRKPILDWVIELGEAADVVVAVGTCAAYGGLPAAGRHDSDGGVGSDPTGARGLQFDGRDPGGVFGPAFESGRGLPVVNVPGCPAHPEHVLLTLATLLAGHEPELDEFGRPLPIFGPLVHDDCDLRSEYEAGNFAQYPGDDGCLYDQGCAGVYSYCDDSLRLRNGGTTICRQVGAPCIGCVEPAFWDRFTPFYEPGDDDGCAGLSEPSVGTPTANRANDRSERAALGRLSAGLLGMTYLPLVPVAAGASLVRWLLDAETTHEVSTTWDPAESAAAGPISNTTAGDGRSPTAGEDREVSRAGAGEDVLAEND